MANSTLQAIVRLWESQIELSKKVKKRQFDDTAQRAWGFLGKSYRQLYLSQGQDDSEGVSMMAAKGPYFKARRNLSREYIALMMPFIHAKIPHRLAEPLRPPLPHELGELLGSYVPPQVTIEERLRSWMLTWWLNYTPNETNLTHELRTCLPEALVKGRGIVWHEIVDNPMGPIPGSFYGTVDDLFIDPDCEQFRDAAFIVRRRRKSAWRLAEEFGIPVGHLRGKAQSHYQKSLEKSGALSELNSEDKELRDIVEYYEVYSRMGIGAKLKGADEALKEQRETLETLSPYVYLVICPGVPYPLNLPEDVLESPDRKEEMLRRLEWPIPFHQASDPFPVTCLDFYPNAHDPWAASPLEGALPLLVFLDHLYSYIIGRIRVTCRDIIVTSSTLGDAIKSALESGLDQEIVKHEGPASELAELIHIIKFPEMRAELWNVVSALERAFERASGMDPLLYGSGGSKQMRSAREADIREGHVTSRPNDFADMVEDFNSRIGAKEAIATRLFVPPPWHLFGENPPEDPENPDYSHAPLSAAWAAYVNTDDPVLAASYMRYRVESGSGRRKNRQARIADAQNLTQLLIGPALQLATAGSPNQWNTLMDILGEMYEMPMERMKIAMQQQPQLMLPQGQPGNYPEGAPT